MAGSSGFRRSGTFVLSLALLGLLAVDLTGGPAANAQIFSRPNTSTTETRPQRRESSSNRKKESSRRRRPTRAEPPPPPQPERASFADPIEYCAYYPDVDVPDEAYTGEPSPQWMRLAAGGASPASGDALFWRCASGRVIACLGPGNAREDGGRCARASRAEDADIRGFVAANWLDVTSYDARFANGDVPGQYLGSRKGRASGSAYDEDDYVVQLDIAGGALNEIVGEARYVVDDGDGAQSVCTSQLRLVAVADNAISLNQESPRSNKTPCRASRQLVLQAVGATARLQSYEVRRGRRELKMETWLY